MSAKRPEDSGTNEKNYKIRGKNYGSKSEFIDLATPRYSEVGF